MLHKIILISISIFIINIYSHGTLVYPLSNRIGINIFNDPDSCINGACKWFTNNVNIPQSETLPVKFRSVSTDGIGDIPNNLFKKNPWRAPGTAPVLGNGCGVAGGSNEIYINGGTPIDGYKNGFDGLLLPEKDHVTWNTGSVVEVAWAIKANHGGGYAYRLCKNIGLGNDGITEECFQKNHLKFYSNISYIVNKQGKYSYPFINTKVTEGTYPKGSEWLRNPVPECNLCNFQKTCGEPIKAVPGYNTQSTPWFKQQLCQSRCAGEIYNDGGSCQDALTQFKEPIKGISGFGAAFNGVEQDFVILDKVIIPENLEPGKYLLSWRWDCEESSQIWQNCADILIKKETSDKQKHNLRFSNDNINI